MNTKGLLDQLLKHGGDYLGKSSGGRSASTKKAGGMMNSFGGGAVTGGALGYLLGNKKGRKVGGKVLAYGGLAALGVMAYKAYSNYQGKQQASSTQPHTPQTADRVSDSDAETHSLAVLIAIIGAAKADGHIDERERQVINDEVGKLGSDAETSQWLQAELGKPLDPAHVASAASSSEIAAEMYLASVFVVDSQNFMERSYLQELARQLKLDSTLQSELDEQAQQALGQQVD